MVGAFVFRVDIFCFAAKLFVESVKEIKSGCIFQPLEWQMTLANRNLMNNIKMLIIIKWFTLWRTERRGQGKRATLFETIPHYHLRFILNIFIHWWFINFQRRIVSPSVWKIGPIWPDMNTATTSTTSITSSDLLRGRVLSSSPVLSHSHLFLNIIIVIICNKLYYTSWLASLCLSWLLV